MALQIRRGNTSERVAATPADGEISWDKTLKQLFVGELGSPNVWTNVLSTAAGTGLQWNSGTSKLDVTGASFNSDVIVEGSTNRFFTNERAQDAVATMFTTTQYILTTTPSKSGAGPYLVTYYFSATSPAPNTSYQYTVAGAANTAFNGTKTPTASSTTSVTLAYASDPGSWISGGTVTITSVLHTGIAFMYDDVNDKLLATVTAGTLVQSDTSPTLGGNLTLNSYSITGTGSISITGAISGTTISAGTGLGASLSLNGNNITGTGNINTTGTFYASSGLGGNLVLNGNNITGTGNINTTGNITASGTITATTGLGANLSLNGKNITGTGDINIIGTITGTLNATLGANLALNGNSITGSGNISNSGTITASDRLSLIADGINTKDGNLSGFGVYTTLSQGLDLCTYRGTSSSRAITQAGDFVGSVTIKGLTTVVPSADYKVVSAMVGQWDATATLTDDYPRSNLRFIVGGGGTTNITATFDYRGVFQAPVFQLTSYATDAARSAAIPSPAAGMMVFMASGTSPAVTNKAVIYNGTAWALLPG